MTIYENFTKYTLEITDGTDVCDHIKTMTHDYDGEKGRADYTKDELLNLPK